MSCGQAHRGGLGCLGLGKEALRAVETGVHVGMSRRVDGGWPCGGGNAAELRVHAQREVTVRSTEAVSVACARGKVPGGGILTRVERAWRGQRRRIGEST
jgi:hypothetical protein